MYKMKLIGKGAEANLYLDGDRLIKHRTEKKYRIPAIDGRLRRSRTKREFKLLENARKIGVPVPEVYRLNRDENKIAMEFIDGELIKNVFESESTCDEKIGQISMKLGESISKLHNSNIIHNDLTTSNMLLRGNTVFFIDFGLGITSTRVEDKAMDLVVLKKALIAAHTKKFDMIWDGILGGYMGNDKNNKGINQDNKKEINHDNNQEINKKNNKKEILKKMEVIEKRVRYA